MAELATSVQEELANLVASIISYMPNLLGGLLILVAGYVAAFITGEVVARLVDRLVERTLEKTSIGQQYRQFGIDLSDTTAVLVKAFVIVLALIVALPVLKIPGQAGEVLTQIVYYLPRVVGGLLVLLYGFIFAGVLTDFINAALAAAFQDRREFATMLKNFFLIGLIAAVITIALNLMLVPGEFVYPVILGFLVIAFGILITDILVGGLAESEEFKGYVGYAKFLLYTIFALIAMAALFANFPGVTRVITVLSIGVAIAAALILIPVIYKLAKSLA